MGVSKIGAGPQNGWFIMENPLKLMIWGVKNTIFGNTHIALFLRGESNNANAKKNVQGFQRCPLNLGKLHRNLSPPVGHLKWW